jgi:hypothetical protein
LSVNEKYLLEEFIKKCFLFSGFRSTGPFVVMIYTMIRGDLLRFCLIFFVFMAGFSQALHVLFVRIECDDNDFGTVIKTFFRMFCVTLQQIADAYRNFYLHPNTGIQVIGKVKNEIFIFY